MRWFRRMIAAAVLSMSTVVAVIGPSWGQDKVVRIGYQKYGTLVLLKSKGMLEEKLEPLGYTVEWTEFPAGPQLLEALNVGAIDFGTTGEAPPIFAQAAGAPLVYVAHEPPAPKGEAILVPEGQPAQVGRRPQGQEGRAEQGLQRPLSAGEGAGEGRRRTIPTSRPVVPAAGRCARRLREGRGRCLGDLGSVPGRGRGRDRRAHARRRHGHRRQPSVLSRRAVLRRSATPRSSTSCCDAARRDRRLGQGRHPTAVAAQFAPALGIPAPVLEVALEAADLRHQADRRRRGRRAAEDRRHLPRARPASRSRSRSPTRCGGRGHERAAANARTSSGSCRPMATAAISAPRIGGRAVDLGYLRQIAQAADELGYYGVLLPTGRELRGFLGRRLGAGAADRAAALPRRGAARPAVAQRRGAHDRDARPALRRPAADQRRHRRRSGREQGRRHLPRPRRALRGHARVPRRLSARCSPARR